MSQDVLISQNDTILELRLNRPAKKNALTSAMYGAMADAIEGAEKDDAIRAVLLSAEGDIFSAGNDLADFVQAATTGSTEALDNVVRFVDAFAMSEKPIVAAVSGDGIGIGATILLHCDIVVIAEGATLKMPFTSLGLTPEAGSSLLTPRLIGDKRAFMMVALGEPLSAEDAVKFGFATVLAEPQHVDARARQAAECCAKVAPDAMRITKRLLRDKDAIRARMDAETAYFKDRLNSPEARAAFEAFFKR